MLLEKEDELRLAQKGAGFGRIVPLEFKNEMNQVKSSNLRL